MWNVIWKDPKNPLPSFKESLLKTGKVPLLKTTIDFEALSGEKQVYLSISGRKVYHVTKGNNSRVRGIHFVVVSQYTGRVMATSIFDTYASDRGEIKSYLESIQPGRLLIMMAGDEVTEHLSKQTRILLTRYYEPSPNYRLF